MQHGLLDFELLHNGHTFLSWLQEDGQDEKTTPW